MKHQPPAVQSFIRPVGPLPTAYCYRVDRVHPADEDGVEVLECTRFGLSTEGTPVKDGKQDKHWLDSLHRVANGVWRDEFDFKGNPRWTCCPIYYRSMSANEHGQRDLFT